MDGSDGEDSTDWLQEAKDRKIKKRILQFSDLKDPDHAKWLYDKFGVASDVDKQISLRQFVSEFQAAEALTSPPGEGPEGPVRKQPKTELKAFDIKYLKFLNSISADGTWQDQGTFTFRGRNQFVETVKKYLTSHLHSPPASPNLSLPAAKGEVTLDPQGEERLDTEVQEDMDEVSDDHLDLGVLLTPPDPGEILALAEVSSKKRAKALVYSSVSGTGKTVSMLELKRLLRKDNQQVVVAYLGFNCCLGLLQEEKDYLRKKPGPSWFIERAREVLARRLVASTIISLHNPDKISELPLGDKIYKGYSIPTVEESKQLLLTGTKASENNPIYIVAGVDEVQLLNNEVSYGPGLGRLFLRILREWQCEWYADGIRLLPLGTGIAIDWSSDPTLGYNVPMHGGDTTLISKEDFKSLVRVVIMGFIKKNKFIKRFGEGVAPETVIDVVSSAYWPRVRLVEHFKNGDTDLLGNRDLDDNAEEHWLTWLCHWLRDEQLLCKSKTVPGGNKEGKIYTLFTLASDSKFHVIPDGYTSSSLIKVLEEKLAVPGLYANLDFVKSLRPEEFMLRDAYDFDKLGFHVVGAAIHVGMYALDSTGLDITLDSATEKQKKRLGLALWFRNEGAVTQGDYDMLVPRVLGKATPLSGEDSDFFPFAGTVQTSFKNNVVEVLSNAKNTGRPVYIRCGRRAICDYLYFYSCKSDKNGTFQFICMVGDAKHSCQKGTSICTSDQEQLFRALICVDSAMKAKELPIKAVRLVFVTNKTKLSAGRAGSKAMKALQSERNKAQKLFPHVNQELLNQESFEFGPFSDILSAERPS